MSLWRKNSAKTLRVVRQLSVYLKRDEGMGVAKNTGSLGDGGGKGERRTDIEKVREEERRERIGVEKIQAQAVGGGGGGWGWKGREK